MEAIFYLLLLIAGLVSPAYAQYSSDQIDIVDGALLAECTFFGDYTVDCTGRVRCHPSDVEDRITITQLDRVCPSDPSIKSGTWSRGQVIPETAMTNIGTGRVAKCKFNANHGNGKFTCTGVNGDVWKGTYSGTMNTAFKLGLPLASSQSTYLAGPFSYDRYTTASPYYAGSSYDRYTTPFYSSVVGNDGYPSRDRYNSVGGGRDDYYGATTRGYGMYGTTRQYGAYDPDRYVSPTDSRYQTTYRGTDNYDRDRDTRYPNGATTSQITMCTYKTDGSGTCRDCSERVDRQETQTEIRTTKHYTCSGPETRTSWTENSAIMPAGQRPDIYGSKRIAATCIYRPTAQTFECHGGSSDGSCGQATDRYGSSDNSLSRCLTGEKWTGTYRGSIY